MVTTIESIKTAIKKWDQIRNADIALNFLTSGNGFHINKEEFSNWMNIHQNAIADGNDGVKNIHFYIGIVEFEIFFFLVDSVTDSKGKAHQSAYVINTNLFIKEFTDSAAQDSNETSTTPDLKFAKNNGLCDNEIDEKEALRRALRWSLHAPEWFGNNKNRQVRDTTIDGVEYKGILKGMSIPFSDLELLFSNDVDRIFAFPGLRTDKMPIDLNSNGSEELEVANLELILCGQKTNQQEFTEVTQQFADVTLPCPPYSVTDYNLF